LLREQEDLAWAPRPFAVLELALVRLATMPAGDDVAALLGRLDALERRLAGAAPPAGPDGGAAPAPGGARGRRAGARRAPGADAAPDPEAPPEAGARPAEAEEVSMPRELEGRVALVTGATSGIGRATALLRGRKKRGPGDDAEGG